MAARAGVGIRGASAAPCSLWEGMAGEGWQDALFGIRVYVVALLGKAIECRLGAEHKASMVEWSEPCLLIRKKAEFLALIQQLREPCSTQQL